MRYIRCAIVALMLLLATPVMAVVLRVDGVNGSPTGDGTGWGSSAFKYIPDALALAHTLASGPNPATVDIWVAATPSPYLPDRSAANPGGTGLRSASFTITNDGEPFGSINLYGGFAGTEGSFEERAPLANVTVLCGDIGTAGDDSDNAYHVVSVLSDDGTDEYSIVIDVFTIGHGNADGSGDSFSGNGGGIFIETTDAAVVRCTFRNNHALRGGGLYGFAAFVQHFPDLTNSVFLDNTADQNGGAVYSNTIRSQWVNCLIARNTAGQRGGGVYMTQGTTSLFANCTLADNHAGLQGGGFHLAPAGQSVGVTINNAIFWGNTSGDPAAPDQVGWSTSSPPVLQYCDVEGGFAGSTNIDTDPLFVNPAIDNYRPAPAPGSLIIDGGNPDDSVIPVDEHDVDQDEETGERTPDLAHQVRVIEVVDIGAYERCPGDTNNDGVVNVLDLLNVQVFCWGTSGWNCPHAGDNSDLNGDGTVNIQDFIEIILYWGTTCERAEELPQSVEDCIEKLGDDPVAIYSCIEASGFFGEE